MGDLFETTVKGGRMTIQEEIREGVARIGVGGINPLKNARPNENGYKTADDIIAYLHSQGVVIRGNLIDDTWSSMEYIEPIIKEVKE